MFLFEFWNRFFERWDQIIPLSRTDPFFFTLAKDYAVWTCGLCRIMVIFWWLYFNLIYRRHPKRWVLVVLWLNYFILAVDRWGSSAQHLVRRTVVEFVCLYAHHAASHGFWGKPCTHTSCPVRAIIFNLVKVQCLVI